MRHRASSSCCFADAEAPHPRIKHAAFDCPDSPCSHVVGTDDPDLSGFKKAGGKLIVWHGLVDQLIFPQGTTDYDERVKDELGGREKTERFARLFLAPGVAHCAGGPGPQPDNPLNALVEWVERGKAPDTLNAVVRNAGGVVAQSRPLCLYPRVAAYKGRGDPMSAASFVCRNAKHDHDDHADD